MLTALETILLIYVFALGLEFLNGLLALWCASHKPQPSINYFPEPDPDIEPETPEAEASQVVEPDPDLWDGEPVEMIPSITIATVKAQLLLPPSKQVELPSTVKALKELAKAKKIPNYGRLSKSQLLAALA